MGAEQLQRRLNEVPCVHITVCACTFLVSKRPMDAEQLQRWLNEVPCVHITVCACTFLVSYRLDVSSRAVRIDSHESFILSLLPIALKQHAIIVFRELSILLFCLLQAVSERFALVYPGLPCPALPAGAGKNAPVMTRSSESKFLVSYRFLVSQRATVICSHESFISRNFKTAYNLKTFLTPYYPEMPWFALSCSTMPSFTLPCPELPCPASPCPALPCPVLRTFLPPYYPALPWFALYCYTIPCPVLRCRVLPHHALPYPDLSCSLVCPDLPVDRSVL